MTGKWAAQRPATQISNFVVIVGGTVPSVARLSSPVAPPASPAPTLAIFGPICSHNGATTMVPLSDAASCVVTQVVVLFPTSSRQSVTIFTPKKLSGFVPGTRPPKRVYVPCRIVMVRLASAVIEPPTTM